MISANEKLGLPRDKMKKITIAFDIDGTLRSNLISGMYYKDKSKIEANEEIRTLLILLSKFKNVKIIVWSGGGELYARQVGMAIGIDQYVDKYASKLNYDGKPDIAIDDIQDTALGVLNLIVKQK